MRDNSRTEYLEGLARKHGVSRTTIHTRLKAGWDPDSPLPPPPRPDTVSVRLAKRREKDSVMNINRVLAKWRTR